MNIGDIVVVIDSRSLPITFIGRYGLITDVLDYDDDSKVLIQFARKIRHIGSLSHTARESDLEKIGETIF
jgi:hypothetical protein